LITRGAGLFSNNGSAARVHRNCPRTFSSYQPAAPEVRPQPEYAPATPKALTESESIAREIKEGNLSGFVGSGTVVTGEANFKAMMRVDGHLSGRVNSSSGTLIVGANGKVDANIEVAVAVIHGTVNGDIIATQRLELGHSSLGRVPLSAASLVGLALADARTAVSALTRPAGSVR
jgi:hypothetical protein